MPEQPIMSREEAQTFIGARPPYGHLIPELAESIVALHDQVGQLRAALESMCEQYLTNDRDDDFHHMFMSAGEEACEVLCRLFPDRWRPTGDGAARAVPQGDET